jgi:hypothetical protein
MSKDRHISKDQALDLLDEYRIEITPRRKEWNAPEGRRESKNQARLRSIKAREKNEKNAQREIREHAWRL